VQFPELVDLLDVGGEQSMHYEPYDGIWHPPQAKKNCSAFVEENEEGKCQSTSSNGKDEKVGPPRESKHCDMDGK